MCLSPKLALRKVLRVGTVFVEGKGWTAAIISPKFISVLNPLLCKPVRQVFGTT